MGTAVGIPDSPSLDEMDSMLFLMLDDTTKTQSPTWKIPSKINHKETNFFYIEKVNFELKESSGFRIHRYIENGTRPTIWQI